MTNVKYAQMWRHLTSIEVAIKKQKDELQNIYIEEHGKLPKGAKVKLDGEICTVSDTCVSELGEIVYVVDWASGGCAYVNFDELEVVG